MAASSNIEWTDHTWNPWEGCQKVGPGCDNCYAEVRNARFGGGEAPNWGPGMPRRRSSESNRGLPTRWNKAHDAFFAKHGRRQRVFSLSLGDWLDNQVPIEWLVDMLDTVRRTTDLDWLLLTKRIGTWRARLELARDHAFNHRRDELHRWIAAWLDGRAPDNVWLGASIVNQEEADRDIAKLLMIPAVIRFLSMEPLLGPVDLTCVAWPDKGAHRVDVLRRGYWNVQGVLACGPAAALGDPRGGFTNHSDMNGIDWVIVGGESGAGARPIHPEWARSLRDQCLAAEVPFMFKQWGEWLPGQNRPHPTITEPPQNKQPRFVACWQDGDPADPASPCWGQREVSRQRWAAGGYHLERGEKGFFAMRVGKKVSGRLLDGQSWDGFPR